LQTILGAQSTFLYSEKTTEK